MASFVLSFFPLDVLDEIWDLIESVSEGFLTYSSTEACVGGVSSVSICTYCTRTGPVEVNLLYVHFSNVSVASIGFSSR